MKMTQTELMEELKTVAVIASKSLTLLVNADAKVDDIQMNKQNIPFIVLIRLQLAKSMIEESINQFNVIAAREMGTELAQKQYKESVFLAQELNKGVQTITIQKKGNEETL